MNHKGGDYGAHIQTISLRNLLVSLSCTHKKRLCDGMDEKRVPERSLNPVQFHTSAHCMLSALMPNSSRFSRVFSLPAEAGNEADERMNYNSELVSHKTTTMG